MKASRGPAFYFPGRIKEADDSAQAVDAQRGSETYGQKRNCRANLRLDQRTNHSHRTLLQRTRI